MERFKKVDAGRIAAMRLMIETTHDSMAVIAERLDLSQATVSREKK